MIIALFAMVVGKLRTRLADYYYWDPNPGLQSLSGESPAACLLDGSWVLSLWAALFC